MRIEARLEELGLVLPEPMEPPPGLHLPFSWARVRADRAYVSGHAAMNPDGSLAGPFGQVGAEISVEQGYEAARRTSLAALGSRKRALGGLGRGTAWGRVGGMVNPAPGFAQEPKVRHGFSDLILEGCGREAGGPARSAVGMAGGPLGLAV